MLGRLGWQFVRVRGSIFFRDEERAMQPVYQRLEEPGITPDAKTAAPKSPAGKDEPVQRVIRRAEALRLSWQDKKPGKEPVNRLEIPAARSNRARAKAYSVA